jgi:hypothetical protein
MLRKEGESSLNASPTSLLKLTKVAESYLHLAPSRFKRVETARFEPAKHKVAYRIIFPLSNS